MIKLERESISNILLKVCNSDGGNVYYKENEISKLNGKS